MANPLVDLSQVSGQWTLNLESKVPRTELYEKRIASSKPSLGFFVLDQFQCDRHIGLDFQQHSCGDWRHDRGAPDGPDPQSCFWDFRC